MERVPSRVARRRGPGRVRLTATVVARAQSTEHRARGTGHKVRAQRSSRWSPGRTSAAVSRPRPTTNATTPTPGRTWAAGPASWCRTPRERQAPHVATTAPASRNRPTCRRCSTSAEQRAGLRAPASRSTCRTRGSVRRWASAERALSSAAQAQATAGHRPSTTSDTAAVAENAAIAHADRCRCRAWRGALGPAGPAPRRGPAARAAEAPRGSARAPARRAPPASRGGPWTEGATSTSGRLAVVGPGR